MELNMTEHGLDVNVSYNESDDFDNAVVLSLVNQLVEALRDVEDVNVSITSEYVINEDADEVLAYMENKFAVETYEDDSEEESDEEVSEDKSSDEETTTEEDQKDNH